jgi:SpoVK/Ycf46/Vps4 family AAA+-type ATPase
MLSNFLFNVSQEATFLLKEATDLAEQCCYEKSTYKLLKVAEILLHELETRCPATNESLVEYWNQFLLPPLEVSMDDVYVPQKLKEALTYAFLLPFYFPKNYIKGAKQEAAILLFGPSGTGKSMLCRLSRWE